MTPNGGESPIPDDDIIPGPLDEEQDEDDSPSDSVPGEDDPPDLDEGDPDSADKLPIRDPLIVDN